ncbi:hypothetical protein EJ06DRAFT_95241 [Trichodelitschia bisporula]|uniref:Uncharacterized protein n=1 Tax=Trichodelitschia bisporula TaxID=703511 RepID=A0A6G1HT60_9PEZI|nr:hypothetical protein EJ06DRAFT_95241 [Trichodelitschia bisporula]
MLGANNGKLYGSPTTATHGSVDSLLAMPTATYDFELLSTEPTSYFDATQMVSAAEPVSQSMGYFDSSLAAVAEDGDFTTLEGWSIPSATTDFFLPADLPLSAATYTSDYAQPLSHSGESAYLSAPGLTAPSSGSQSEVGDHGLVLEADIASAHTDEPITGFWKDTVQFRDSYRVNSGAEYAYNGDVKGEMGLAGYVEAMAAARHASDATVVPTTSATPLEQVNVGHMQNLAALKGSRLAAATGGLMGASSVSLSSLESSSAGSTPVDGEWGPGAGEPEGILIPAGIEDAPRHEDWLYSGREMRGQDYFWLS